MTEKADLIQSYMDAAYTRWQDNEAQARAKRDEAIAAIKASLPEGEEPAYHLHYTNRYGGWSQKDFWDQLDKAGDTINDPERFSVFLGNLNYQVCNGGFGQWWGNNYMCEETVDYIVKICTKMDTQASNVVAALVKEAWDRTDHQEYDVYCKAQRHRDDDDDDDSEPSFDHLDTAFYAVNEQFIKDAEEYLARRLPGRKGDWVKLTLAEAKNILTALVADGNLQEAYDVLKDAIADAERTSG